jgi:threonine dehydrogenase-like Zn-dependent dehydrogenase
MNGVFKLTTIVVIDTDYTGSCKSNYHMITTAPTSNRYMKITCNKTFG